ISPGVEETPFVGRVTELAALHAAFDDVRIARRPAIVHLEGTSGVGKSTLLRQFLDGLEPEHAIVLRGRCHIQESVPYKALDAVIDALTRVLRRKAELLRNTPGAGRGDLVQLFPVLAGVPGLQAFVADTDISEPRERRRRGVMGLRELLERVANELPLIVAIDDVQSGDVDSAALLEALVRPPQAPAMLLVLSYRSENRERIPVLQTLARDAAALPRDWVPTIRLPLVTSGEAAELTRHVCGDDDAGTLAQIIRESAGSPFLITQMARAVG